MSNVNSLNKMSNVNSLNSVNSVNSVLLKAARDTFPRLYCYLAAEKNCCFSAKVLYTLDSPDPVTRV